MSNNKQGVLSPSFGKELKKYSIACELSYRYSEAYESNKVNQEIDKMNRVFRSYDHHYRIVSNLSDNKIIVCKDQNNYIIGVKGTHAGSNTQGSDLKADSFILFSMEKYSSEFKNRCSKIVELIKIFKGRSPNCKIYLSGHSLSGGIIHHCMISNEYIFSNIDKCHIFNPGVGLGYIRKSLANMTFTQDQENKFNKKMVIYHVSGDRISSLSNGLKGTYREFRLKESYLQHLYYYGSILSNPIYNYIMIGIRDTSKYHSIKNFIL